MAYAKWWQVPALYPEGDRFRRPSASSETTAGDWLRHLLYSIRNCLQRCVRRRFETWNRGHRRYGVRVVRTSEQLFGRRRFHEGTGVHDGDTIGATETTPKWSQRDCALPIMPSRPRPIIGMSENDDGRSASLKSTRSVGIPFDFDARM